MCASKRETCFPFSFVGFEQKCLNEYKAYIPSKIRLVWFESVISNWVREMSVFNKGLHSTMNPTKWEETTLLHRTIRALSSWGVADTFGTAVWTTQIKHIACLLQKRKQPSHDLMVVMRNERCTFRNGYGNFSRFGFSSSIYSAQIQLCYFAGKLKSTVIPPCGTDPSLCAWHNISYVLTVGMKPFGCLAGRKVGIYYLGSPSSFDQKIKCGIMTGAEKLVFFVYLPHQVLVHVIT